LGFGQVIAKGGHYRAEFGGAAGLRRAIKCTTGRRRRSRAIKRLQSWRSGAAELARIAADERASVRSPGANGARESELRSTSGMISWLNAVSYLCGIGGFDYFAIELNNQNDVLEIASQWSQNKSARECFARAQLSTIDI
jgi:hypothetical protein